jgi:hypothetical protein
VRTVDAVDMVNAGISWITPGGFVWAARLRRAAKRGDISRETLERNVALLLRGFGGIGKS